MPITPDQARVFVVEDNGNNLALIMLLLRDDVGVKMCKSAPSGARLFQYVEAYKALTPHLILLDLQLPGEDGYQILERIRQNTALQNTIVVACTANIDELKRTKEAGFDGFLGKPLNVDKFEDQITRILAGEAVWEAQ